LLELISSVFAHRFSSNVNTTDLKNVLSISTKALKPQEHASEIWEHYSIPAFDEKHRPIFEPASEIKSNKYQIDNECILISKLNPSTKRIWMPYCSSNNAVCSTEFIVYRPYLKEYKSFYYAAIDSPGFTDYLLEHVSGSTGSRQRAQPKDTLHYLMPNPSNEEIKNFCTFADPIYRHVQINEQQTAKLELLRDTLLPKLMSGEIDVSKVDLTQLTNNHLADC
jgi:type I restriction enzyme S subunit